MERLQTIDEMMQRTVGLYSVLNYEIKLNDDSDNEFTAYEVEIKNKTNDIRVGIVLQCNDIGEVEILKGEDFTPTDDLDFAMNLFMEVFLTFQEI